MMTVGSFIKKKKNKKQKAKVVASVSRQAKYHLTILICISSICQQRRAVE